MPHLSYSEFIDLAMDKRLSFAMTKAGANVVFYVGTEVAKALALDTTLCRGRAERVGKRLRFHITGRDSDGEDSRAEFIKALTLASKAAGRLGDERWNKASVLALEKNEQLSPLQRHALAVLNPDGAASSPLKVPFALSAQTIEEARQLMGVPESVPVERVDAEHITLDTPVPSRAPARPTGGTPDASPAVMVLRKLEPAIAQALAAVPEKWAAEEVARLRGQLLDAPSREVAWAATMLKEYVQTGMMARYLSQRLSVLSTDYAAALNIAQTASPQAYAEMKRLYGEARELRTRDVAAAAAALDQLQSKVDKALALPRDTVRKELEALQPQLDQLRTAAPGATAELQRLQQEIEVELARRPTPNPVLWTRQIRQLRSRVLQLERQSKAEAIERAAGQALFLSKDENGSTMMPSSVTRNEDKIDELALATGQTPDRARAVLANLFQSLKDRTATLVPNGFKPTNVEQNLVNPLLPDESRPKLTLDEAVAITAYTSLRPPKAGDKIPATNNGTEINNPLRAGRSPASPHDKTLKLLNAAFAKSRKMTVPVDVTRDLQFEDPAPFLKQFVEGEKSKQPVTLLGFMSTATGGRPPGFKLAKPGEPVKVTVVLHIRAWQGLDVSPYTELPKEKELLLAHGTQLRVDRIATEDGEVHVYGEQVV